MKNTHKDKQTEKIKAFLRKEELERVYINKFFNTNYFKKYNKKLFMHESGTYTRTDASIYLFEKGTTKLSKRILLEIKVRDRFYPKLMLERLKLNGMKQERTKRDKQLKENGYDIKSILMYLCVTPNASYLYNLDKIEFKKEDWVLELHNNNDFDKSKIEKEITYLDVNKAKEFSNIKTDILKYNEIYTEQKRMTNQNQNKILFQNILEGWD